MTQFYANADTSGNIIAYYNDDIWDVAKIPTTAIKITEAQWHDTVANQGKYVVKEGALAFAPAPTAVQQLATAQAAKIAILKASMDAQLNAPLKSSALLGTVKTYTYDPAAKADFMRKAIILSLNPNIANVSWPTHEDGFINHTRAQFIQVITNGDTFEENIKMKYSDLKAKVNAATTVDAVNAIVW